MNGKSAVSHGTLRERLVGTDRRGVILGIALGILSGLLVKLVWPSLGPLSIGELPPISQSYSLLYVLLALVTLAAISFSYFDGGIFASAILLGIFWFAVFSTQQIGYGGIPSTWDLAGKGMVGAVVYGLPHTASTSLVGVGARALRK